MTLLALDDVPDDGLGPLSLRFEQGLFTLISSAPAPLARATEILAGVRRAQRGCALLDGRNVFESPDARRAIAALLPAECALPAPSAGVSLELAAKLHEQRVSARDVLERAGLSRLASIPPERLSLVEQRALALVLALTLSEASACKVLLLHDPFSLHALVPKAWTLARCREQATRLCVLVTATRIEDAIELGGATRWLERGRSFPHLGLWPRSGAGVGLTVRSEDAEQLARLCQSEPNISYVLFDAERCARELLLFGPELDSLARAVCELARKASLSLDALAPLPPPLPSGST